MVRDVGMVPEAVEQRRGEFLVAEDLHPLAEREVGRDDRRAPLVAVGEEVEQQLAAGALEGHEAELVDDQQRDPQVTLMEPRERELVTCLDQLAHEVGGADEGDAVAAAGGLDAERDREVRLAGADRPGDDDVVGALDVLATRELCELWPLDAPRARPRSSCSKVLMSGKRAWRSRRATALSRRASTSASISCTRNSS